MALPRLSPPLLGDEIRVERGCAVLPEEAFREAVRWIESNHSAWIAGQLDRVLAHMPSALSASLQTALADELIVQELNSFDFDRLASWELGRLSGAKSAPGAMKPVSILSPPQGFVLSAFLAGWDAGTGGHGSRPRPRLASHLAGMVALGILVASFWGKWRLRAGSGLPAAHATFVTPTAMTNQGRHAFEMAAREPGSAVVLLGHGLLGGRRAHAIRRSCGAAALVWPVSFAAIGRALPQYLKLVSPVERAASMMSIDFGRRRSLGERIELCARLLRGLVFAQWAAGQPWPRTVAFSIGSRLDRQIADEALRRQGAATAHMIHGLHGAGNAWGYRASNALAITFLESERPLRRRYGRYGRETSLQALRPGPGHTSALTQAGEDLLLCTNMLHRSNPWFKRDPARIHLKLFDAAERWAKQWGCRNLLWRPHPAGAVHAPRQYAELCAAARMRGWSVADGPMAEVLARSKIVLTPPSGVFIDALRHGRVPLLVSGVVNEVLEPWTNLPPELWVDIDASPSKDASKLESLVDHLPDLQAKFLHPTWSEVAYADIDRAAWSAADEAHAVGDHIEEST